MRVLVINCGSTTLKYKLFEERRRRAGERSAAATVEIAGGYRRRGRASDGGAAGAARRHRASGRARRRPAARGGPHRPGGAPGAARGHSAGAAAQRAGARGDRGHAREPGSRWSRPWTPPFMPAFHPGPGAMPFPSSRACADTAFTAGPTGTSPNGTRSWPGHRSLRSSRSISAAAARPRPSAAGARWTPPWATRPSRAW